MKVKCRLKQSASSPPSLLENLNAWERAGESETLEFKRTTNERREAVRSRCAVVHHRGGRVLFGVSSDGEIVGQRVSDRTTIPPSDSDMATQVFKDPYLFDFLGTAEPRHERDVESALVAHIQRFLLELGQGFAFVGQQVHLLAQGSKGESPHHSRNRSRNDTKNLGSGKFAAMKLKAPSLVESRKRSSASAWNTETQTVINSATIAQVDLTKRIDEAKKSAKNIAVFNHALGMGTNILALTKKVI